MLKPIVALGVIAMLGAVAAGLFLAAAPKHEACGIPAIRAAAPRYLAVEAMPTTLPNVWTRPVGAYTAPPRDNAIGDLDLASSWAPCDEQKPTVPEEYAVRYVGQAWMAGLRAQNEIARFHYMSDGGIPTDPRCLPFTAAGVRLDVASGWLNLGVDHASTGVRTEDLRAVPYLEHVVGLYQKIAVEMDMKLPPVGSEMSPWVARYGDAYDSTKAKAPADKDCFA